MRPKLMRLLVLLLLLVPGPARAQDPHPPPHALAAAGQAAAAPLSPSEAKQLLDVLNDPARRAQFTATLDRMARAMPQALPAPATSARATSAPATSAPATPPAAAAIPAAPAAKPAAPSLLPHSLGAELLVGLSGWLTTFSRQLVATARTLTDFPLLWRWIGHDINEPDARAQLVETGWKLVVVMGAALAAERLVFRGLRRVRAALARHAPPGAAQDAAQGGLAEPEGDIEPRDGAPAEPVAPPQGAVLEAAERGAIEPPSVRHRRLRNAWNRLRRLPFVLARLVADLIPVAVFVGVGNGVLGTPMGDPMITRLVILAVVQAYAVTRAVMCVVRMMVGPPDSRVRLLNVSDHTAAYLLIWARRIVVVVVFGIAIADMAQLLGLYAAAHDALLKLVALIAHLFLIIIVLQQRVPVKRWIRPRKGARGAVAALRGAVAEIWHWIAIFYIVALWMVYAFEIPNGFAKLVHLFVVTVAVLAVARLLALVAFGMLDRGFRISPEMAARYPGLEARANRYYPLLRSTLSGIIAAVTGIALLQVWGVDALLWFAAGRLGGRLVSALLTIGITMLVGVAVWEGANTGIERHLVRLGTGQPDRAVRLRTLLPMLRTALIALIATVVGMTALSEIGVNIAPLLAGAGVIGVAVGFGSQKLVQDLITGLFLLLENAIQVGDVVTVSGLSGSVEHLSIRTIRLRALDGSVHIIPFSAVTTLTNQTRDYGFAVIDVSLSVNEEPDRVADVLREIAAGMRKEERWAGAVSGDLDVMGVDKLLDASWVLRARLRTVSAQRWAVGREFNRRLKYRFDELAIESPFTSHRILSTVPAPPVEAAGTAGAAAPAAAAKAPP